MVNVDIDGQLYQRMKLFVETNRLEYPSIKYFVQKTVLQRLSEKQEV
ncbi:MAG: hypothetical protein ABIG95_01000 [Candidatus Woesearchaeota archaeon]